MIIPKESDFSHIIGKKYIKLCTFNNILTDIDVDIAFNKISP